VLGRAARGVEVTSKLRAIIAIALVDSRNARLRPGQKRGPAPSRNAFWSLLARRVKAIERRLAGDRCVAGQQDELCRRRDSDARHLGVVECLDEQPGATA
jgi:hypothetical protein